VPPSSACSSRRCPNSSCSPRSSASATASSSARRPTTSTSSRPSSCAPRRTALFVSVSQIAGILGNLLGGFLFDAVGGKPFYLIASGLMFLSILVFAVSFIKKGENAPAAENN
jgi:MFS family permease